MMICISYIRLFSVFSCKFLSIDDLIDCVVFNAIFSILSVVSRRPCFTRVFFLTSTFHNIPSQIAAFSQGKKEDNKMYIEKIKMVTQLFTYATMFGCCNSFKRDISRMAVDGTPSSSLSNLIFFKATYLLVFLFLPL